MTADPMIAEIRAWRDWHAARMNYDVHAIFQEIRKMQPASTREFVRHPARPNTAPGGVQETRAAVKRTRRMVKQEKSLGHMTRSKAIKLVNSYLQHGVLDGTNTHFTNVNSAKEVWWFNIPPEKFARELHLLCAKKTELIWLTIEKDAVLNPEKTFRLRQDKWVIDLEISCASNRYMCDVKSGGSGYDFRSHIRREWP